MTTYRYREHPSTIALRMEYIGALYRKVGATPRVRASVARALTGWHSLMWLAWLARRLEREAVAA